MVRKFLLILFFINSNIALTMAQLDEEIDPLLQNSFQVFNRSTKATNLCLAAVQSNPEALAHLLYNQEIGALTNNDIQYAYICTEEIRYVYKVPKFLKLFEQFFNKSLFDSGKMACLSLLEQECIKRNIAVPEFLHKKRD